MNNGVFLARAVVKFKNSSLCWYACSTLRETFKHRAISMSTAIGVVGVVCGRVSCVVGRCGWVRCLAGVEARFFPIVYSVGVGASW